jgi:hypothetical protein
LPRQLFIPNYATTGVDGGAPPKVFPTVAP